VRLAFGDCVLDQSCFELVRRDKPVKLEPKVFDVLVYLIEHRDRVVTKHELLDALWPGEAVSDSVLPRCIAALRRAVGDSRTKQRVIATVHGRGYRFSATLENDPAGAHTARPTPRAPSAKSRAASDFVGRADGLQRLRAMLTRAEKGDGGIALVVGEPGIGKTRLTEELAEMARSGGFEVLVGRCYEGEGAPPYWPWVQILDAAQHETRDDGTLRNQLGDGANDIASLVPELRSRFPELPAAPETGDEQARFRLYDAASRFIGSRASNRPLLIVLDDIHWADASSLGLVRFIARTAASSRFLLLGTYRDMEVRRGHPLADLLGALARESPCERVALSGLDAEEISNYVRQLLGEDPNPSLISTLHEMTDGNPFFLREIVRLIAEDGIAADTDGREIQALMLPQGVKDAIGRRLDALSPECNDMLRAAAVLGRSFPIGILQAMLELPGDAHGETLLELLGEALDAGTIAEASRGSYAFAHALTRQTLYEELRAPGRIALHRRAGECHERGFDANVATDEQLVELARHYLEAAPGGDVDKAVHYCLAAAESSQRKFAHDEAVGFLERAVEAITLRVPVDESRRAELLLALGQARFTAGHRSEAMPTLSAAADLARSVDRVDVLADAAIATRGHGELGAPPGEGVVELLEEALRELPEDDFSRRSRLLSGLNGAVATTMAERDSLAERALEMAQSADDPIALQDAWSAKWWATLGPDRIDDRYQVARELRALAERTRDPRTRLLSHEYEFGADLVRGDFAATERNLIEYERIAAALRQPLFVFMGMNFRTSWLINRGRFAEAESRVDKAYEYGRDLVPFAEATCKGQLFWARNMRGTDPDNETNAGHLGSILHQSLNQGPVVQIFLAMLPYSVDGDTERAHAQVTQIDYQNMDHDEHWLTAMAILTQIGCAVADRKMIEWLHGALLPFADLITVHDLLRGGIGSVANLLGSLDAALGELDAAVDWFERAIAKEKVADMRPARLVSQLGLAGALREQGSDAGRVAQIIEAATREVRALELGAGSTAVALIGKLETD
jgi:DNA-binding winged helix-turn-helix (wHTH) protein/tetratricopeptide (TPR) repeat protein